MFQIDKNSILEQKTKLEKKFEQAKKKYFEMKEKMN